MAAKQDPNSPFTSHGYVPGQPAKPSRLPRNNRPKGGFGSNNGTIVGLSKKEPNPHFDRRASPWAAKTTSVDPFKA